MKQFFLSILTICLFSISYKSTAQILGYGVGTAMTTWTTGTMYTDDIRSRVLALTLSSPNKYNLQYDASNPTSGFLIGNRYLLIQMKGSNIGVHQMVTILRRISTNILEVSPLSSQPMFSYSFGASDRVQLVSVPTYYDFTLNGGEVTSHEWDATTGTGGVLAMTVSHKLTINNGSFTVRGKGFSPNKDETAINWGKGTAGTPPVTPNDRGALRPAPMYGCLSDYGNISLSMGERGGRSNNLPLMGSSTSGAYISYGNSFKFYNLRLGSPGGYKAGSRGGQGGAGGGYGGFGQNSTCVNPGAVGNIGQAGKTGQDAGLGGIGGGVIVIKAAIIQITTPRVAFNASGDNASRGGKGGDGGEGGAGGAGGQGCCVGSVAIPQGGDGGNGDMGAGGKGGDGGNGGRAGYIWIGTSSYSSPAPRAGNYAVKGGKKGIGGRGGWGVWNTTPGLIYIKNECTDAYCDVPSSCNISICNPDKAMCIITTQTDHSQSTFAPGNIVYLFKNSAGVTIGEYNYNTKTVKGFEPNTCGGINEYIGLCRGDCNQMFDILNRSLSVNSLKVSLPNSNSNCSSLGTYPMFINFRDNSATNILAKYEHLNINTDPELYDVYNDFICWFGTCYSPSGYGGDYIGGNWVIDEFGNPLNGPIEAPPGNDGDDAPDGNIDEDNTGTGDENVVIDDGGSWLVNPNTGLADTETELKQANIYPNPAQKELFVNLVSETSETLVISLTDLAGKELLNFTRNKALGNNEYALDISTLPTGMYLLKLSTPNHSFTTKITVK